MISLIRYQQQYQQLQQLRQPMVGQVVTYDGRDAVTGLRSIQTADGGVEIGQYLSNAVPDGVMPLAQSSTIGLVGYVSGKPH